MLSNMKLNSKYLTLLKTAIVFYCLFFSFYFFSSFKFNTESVYNDLIELDFAAELLLIGVLAPIFEELIFRAPIVFNNKRWKIFYLTLFIILIIFSVTNFSLRSLSITLWLSIVVVSKFYLKQKSKSLLIWSSIITFSISHLPVEDFFNFDTLILFIFFFASSSLLTWFIINYGLLKSILFHSTYNLVSFIIYLFILNYSYDDSLKKTCIESQSTCIEWKQKPIFKSTQSKIEYKDTLFNVNNGKIKNVLDILTTLDKDNYEYIIVNDSKIKYDIRIFNEKNKKIDDSLILSSLEKSELIKISKKTQRFIKK